jgi:hypothetical protein
MNRANPPAMVLEHTFERRRAGDVANQADRRGVEINRDRDARFLSSLDDRGDRQVIAQRLATASVNVPDGGTDLGVAIAVDFLLQKVDEPPVALKYRKDSEIRACGNFREERLDPRREVKIGEETPEGPEGQSDSIQVSILVSCQWSVVNCQRSPGVLGQNTRVRLPIRKDYRITDQDKHYRLGRRM